MDVSGMGMTAHYSNGRPLARNFGWRRLGETNMQECLNEEVRRRERVIRIFPNDESALRLIGALLSEQNEVWQERKYLDMDEFKEWADAQIAAKQGSNIVALAG